MIIKKFTKGFVEQVYDTEKKIWISQVFIANTNVECEDDQYNCVNCNLISDVHLPFDMIQPKIKRQP